MLPSESEEQASSRRFFEALCDISAISNNETFQDKVFDRDSLINVSNGL